MLRVSIAKNRRETEKRCSTAKHDLTVKAKAEKHVVRI